MVLGNCSVCSTAQAKYRCPKCPIVYCSLACFKSPDHKHEVKEEGDVKVEKPSIDFSKVEEIDDGSRFKKLLNDERLKYLLSFKSLQYHLVQINDIFKNNSNTNTDKIYELANLKLNKLRNSGDEENELVEEFCQRVTELLNQKS